MTNRKIASAVAVVALAGGAVSLTACGSEPTSQDMRDWQSEVRTTEELKQFDNIGQDAFWSDCEGTVDNLTSALDEVPDPPYKGDEWRYNVDETLAIVDEMCPAVQNGNFLKLAQMEERITKLDNSLTRWINDVNRQYPDLDWNSDTYLEVK